RDEQEREDDPEPGHHLAEDGLTQVWLRHCWRLFRGCLEFYFTVHLAPPEFPRPIALRVPPCGDQVPLARRPRGKRPCSTKCSNCHACLRRRGAGLRVKRSPANPRRDTYGFPR